MNDQPTETETGDVYEQTVDDFLVYAKTACMQGDLTFTIAAQARLSMADILRRRFPPRDEVIEIDKDGNIVNQPQPDMISYLPALKRVRDYFLNRCQSPDGPVEMCRVMESVCNILAASGAADKADDALAPKRTETADAQ